MSKTFLHSFFIAKMFARVFNSFVHCLLVKFKTSLCSCFIAAMFAMVFDPSMHCLLVTSKYFLISCSIAAIFAGVFDFLIYWSLVLNNINQWERLLTWFLMATDNTSTVAFAPPRSLTTLLIISSILLVNSVKLKLATAYGIQTILIKSIIFLIVSLATSFW